MSLSRSRNLVTTLLPPGAGLRVEHVRTQPEAVELRLVTTMPTVPCPICAGVASRVHSRYTRTLADLPWAGRALRISLHIRKFFCTVTGCSRRIFAERLPALVAPFARRTNRLTDIVRLLGFALGGEAGSRLADRLRMATSPSTLLRLLRRTPDAVAAAPRVLGVDDFAVRKGRTYGTLLVDLERHRPIELLPDRTSGSLAAWLKSHPPVDIISRDRSTEYARGATEGAPQAIQVADRFHLLVNLREALERLLDRNRVHLRGFVLPGPGDAAIPASAQRQPGRRSPVEEAARQAHIAARHERHSHIQTLHEQGVDVQGIARQLQLSRGTVYRYLRLDAHAASQRSNRIRSKLDPYVPYLYRRWQDGCHNGLQLWRERASKGDEGTHIMVTRWVRQQRQEPAPTTPRKYRDALVEQMQGALPTAEDRQTGSAQRPASSRQLAWLVLHKPEKLSLAEQAALKELQERCPDVAAAYPLVHEFVRMVRERDGAAYAAWRTAVQDRGLPELMSFVGGLDRDQEAVLAGLTLEWSNGQTEGQVNRLKTVKRQMNGRANFDLLRKRVLHVG